MHQLLLSLFLFLGSFSLFSQNWIANELAVVKKFEIDTSDIRGIELRINNSSVLTFDEVFQDFVLGEVKQDFKYYEISENELFTNYYNRPLAIKDVVFLYVKFRSL